MDRRRTMRDSIQWKRERGGVWMYVKQEDGNGGSLVSWFLGISPKPVT